MSCFSSELQSTKNEKCKFSIYCFNKDISFDITCTLLTFYLPILEYVMEGTVSQIFDFGPSFFCYAMKIMTYEKMTKSYPFFWIK